MKKAVLITGGSSGIGAATAVEFSNHGYFVYLMGRNKERLGEVAERCRAGVMLMPCDLKDTTSIDKYLNQALAVKTTQIECLVNNAGIYYLKSFEETGLDLWQETFQVNLYSHVYITQKLFKYFKQYQKGSIVNVSSTLGQLPISNTTAYSASKAAMNNWTMSLALEGGPFNIRANAVCPGIVDTAIHSFHNLPVEKKAEVLNKMKNLQPLGRIGTPEDIAKSVYFFGCEDSAWTTGTILSVDGGINIM
ncbi:MAG TPA: SDR family oxidoreductase [Pseudobdellovibrionaceae bacterium]|nr:SDR family oxidoreductase [Pseudobdellovibrionaceae bacterium]